MNKPYFNLLVPYALDLSGTLSYGTIPDESLAVLFRDGRIAGMMNEALVADSFRGLTRTTGGNDPFDLHWRPEKTAGSRPLEVKTLTRNGLVFLPSNQRGQGRRKNIPAYNARREVLSGYVVVDVRDCPRLRVTGIDSGFAPDSGTYTPRQWDVWHREQDLGDLVRVCL